MYYRSSKTIVAGWTLLAVVCPICQAIDGSGSANYIPKFTGPSTIGNSVVYESSSNIGIGTQTPSSKLNVVGRLTLETSAVPIILRETDQTLPVGLWRQVTDAGIFRLDGNTDAAGNFATYTTPFMVWSNGTIMFLDGNVGIGTSAPSEKLAVDGNIRVERSVADVSIRMKDSTTSAADPVAIRRTGDNLRLFTNGAERLTIASDGNVTIGTTNNPLGWKLLVAGRTAIAGDFLVDGFSFLTLPSSLPGTYYPVYAGTDGKLYRGPQIGSSLRYKAAVRDLDVNVKSVLDLRPVRFDWKADGKSDIGLIAEEVQEVVPDLVIYDSQGQPNGVKYDKVPMYLLEVIRTQQSQISALEERLTLLEGVIKRLDSKAKSPETDTPVQGVGRNVQ
jgi:hypothetical protein